MSSLPAGEGVGAEPRVNNTQVSLQLFSGQVEVVLPQLAGVELALVDNRSAGEGTDVEPLPSLGDGVGGNLTQHSPVNSSYRLQSVPTFLSMNIFFSISLLSMSSPAGTTNTWLIRGSEFLATEPRHLLSLGGSRHTSTLSSRDLASSVNLALTTK